MPKARKSETDVRIVGERGAIDVSALLQDGVIATLGIGRWRAEKRILPEDLGLENIDTAQLESYMRLGSKTLIPPHLQKKLTSLEGSARYAVKRYSLKTPFGDFVTAAAFKTVAEEMERYKAQWFEMRDQLVSHMKEHQKEVRDGYRELATQVYEQMRKRQMRKDKYARHFARRIVGAIPSAEQIAESFYFEFQLLKVPEPTVLNRQVRQRIMAEETNVEKLQTMREKEQQVREMNEMIAEKWKTEKAELVDRFIRDVNEQIRDMVWEVADAARDSLLKNNCLIGKTSTQLKGMIAKFRMMNVLNDVEIEKLMKSIERSLENKAKGARTKMDLVSALSKLKVESRKISLELKLPTTRTVRDELLAEEEEDSHVALPDAPRIAARHL